MTRLPLLQCVACSHPNVSVCVCRSTCLLRLLGVAMGMEELQKLGILHTK